jgi:Tfp pilus assembly protein FimT
MKRHQRRAGFFLYELLFVIGLMAVVGLLSMRLFVATFRLGQAAVEAQNHANTLDSISAVLRSDVWSTTKLDVSEGKTVKLQKGENRTIVWTVADDTLTRQENNSPPHHWTIVKGIAFASDGGILVLRLPDRGGEARFASEVQLIGRLAR